MCAGRGGPALCGILQLGECERVWTLRMKGTQRPVKTKETPSEFYSTLPPSFHLLPHNVAKHAQRYVLMCRTRKKARSGGRAALSTQTDAPVKQQNSNLKTVEAFSSVPGSASGILARSESSRLHAQHRAYAWPTFLLRIWTRAHKQVCRGAQHGSKRSKNSSIQTLPKSSCAVLRLPLEKAGAWHPGIQIAVAVDHRCQLSASGGSSLSATAWKRQYQCLGLYAARMLNCRNCSFFFSSGATT